jgi:hypothetical protein
LPASPLNWNLLLLLLLPADGAATCLSNGFQVVDPTAKDVMRGIEAGARLCYVSLFVWHIWPLAGSIVYR